MSNSSTFKKLTIKDDADFKKTKEILIESVANIISIADSLDFKYSILAKLKLNHLSNDIEIKQRLNDCINKLIEKFNQNLTASQSISDEEFEKLDIKENNLTIPSSRSLDSIDVNIIDFIKNENNAEFDIKNELASHHIDDYELLANENIANEHLFIKNDYFDFIE